MIPSLTSVKARSKYHLDVYFNDGTHGILDVSSLAGKGVFNAWELNDLFFNPYINEMGAIAWNDFIDIDPLNAYLQVKGITFEDWKQTSKVHASD